MEKRTLRTARLELRPTTSEVFDGLWAAIQTSLPELRVWMAWAVAARAEDTRAFAHRAEESWAAGTAYNFTLVHEGEIAGQCGLDRVDMLVKQCEIGYWMRTDLCGQGLMTEAAAAAVAFGFQEVGVHRIELHAGLGNIGSIRVAEKLGFSREGVLRDRGFGAGGYYDMYVHGL